MQSFYVLLPPLSDPSPTIALSGLVSKPVMLWRLGWWDSPSDSCWCCSWCWMRHWGKHWQQLIDSWHLPCGYRWYLSPRNSKENITGTDGSATRPTGKLIPVDHSQRMYQICPSSNTIWYSVNWNGQQLDNTVFKVWRQNGIVQSQSGFWFVSSFLEKPSVSQVSYSRWFEISIFLFHDALNQQCLAII